MSANEIRVGDIGTIFEVTLIDDTTIVDLTGATVHNLIFKKPNGTIITKLGVIDPIPTTGIMRYTTITGDLDMAGCWQLQAQIALPGGQWRSDIGTFTVYTNLS